MGSCRWDSGFDKASCNMGSRSGVSSGLSADPAEEVHETHVSIHKDIFKAVVILEGNPLHIDTN
jgi:hypothetical protein